MREMGVRELKASLSETLRSVGGGDSVRVTVHGRAVADIVPAGASDSDDGLRALVDAGRLTPPARSRPRRRPRMAQAAASATGAVLADRDAER